MRTTLDLDDELVRALLARHPEMTKTEALEAAVAFYLTRSATEELRRLAGSLEIDDASAEMRAADRRT